jgi:uncharacterized protein (DUF305 family)
MIPHHQSAVQMANIAKRRGTSTFVTQLATSIARAQTAEIATMRAADQRLRKAGVKRGSLGVPDHLMGMGGDVASLNGARPFDTAFMRMMLPHHQGAVTMADSELENGGDPKLKKLAHTIISAQQREIGEMRRHLARRPKMSSGEHMRGSGSMHDTGHAG